MNPIIDGACDCYFIAHVLQEDLPGKRQKNGKKRNESQARIFNMLFYSYTYRNGTDVITFNDAEVNKWFNGTSAISPKIAEHYHSHPEQLVDDVQAQIVPKLANSRMVATTLIKAFLTDDYISEEEKFDFETTFFPKGGKFSYTSSKDLSEKEWDARVIASIVLTSISTEYPTRDPETHKLLLPASPMERLVNYIPKPCNPFLGREDAFAEIDQLFEDHNTVFLYGLSGYGKSELSKAYAWGREAQYTSIVYIPYTGDLKRDIANLYFIGEEKASSAGLSTLRKTGMTTTDGLSDLDYRFETHMYILRSLDKRTLLVFDNFDALPYAVDRAADLNDDDAAIFQQEEFLPTVLQLPCRMLFCTRCDPTKWATAVPFGCLNVSSLGIRNLTQLVSHIYSDASEHKKTVKEIINALAGNTMLIRLTAALLEESMWEPEEILEKLQSDHLNMDASEHIGAEIDGKFIYTAFAAHARTLFKLYVLSDLHKDMLRNLSLMPQSGVYFKRFCSWLNLPNADPVNQLISMGLLNKDQKGKIFLHSLIQQAAIVETHPSISNCHTLINSFTELCIEKLGPFLSKSEDELKAVTTISKGIDKHGTTEDLEQFFKFLENAIPYLLQHSKFLQAEELIDLAFPFLENCDIGTQGDRIAMNSIRLVRNDDPVQAIQYFFKMCFSGKIHIDPIVMHILLEGIKIYCNPLNRKNRPPVMVFLQSHMPALHDARWMRVFVYGFFLLLAQNHSEFNMMLSMEAIEKNEAKIRALAESAQELLPEA